MNKLQKKITTFSATAIFIATIFTGTQTLAQTTLNGVEISSSNNRGYDIVLNTDKNTKINQKTISQNSIELNLKDTKIAKNANTVYKNADGIEHILLKPKANNLKIEINGEQVGKSNIALAPTINENTVFINKPLKSYTPIHQIEEEEISQSISIVNILRNIKNSQTLRRLVDSSNLGWIVSFIMMFGLLLYTNNRNKKRNNIDLTLPSEEDKENKILKAALERKEGLIAQGMGTRRTSLMQPKIQPDLQKTNYGLRAYNNQSGTTNNLTTRIQNTPLKNSKITNIPSSNNSSLSKKAFSTATLSELKESKQKNEVHIDNVRFLESMAKIYEKSGRVDLANGLANNIKRAKNKR